MQCRRCLLLGKKIVGNVPITGRAAEFELCCKCDREVNGKQSQEEWGYKQTQRAERKQQYRHATTS